MKKSECQIEEEDFEVTMFVIYNTIPECPETSRQVNKNLRHVKKLILKKRKFKDNKQRNIEKKTQDKVTTFK